MSENFRDYLVALRDDPELRRRYKINPAQTLSEARISKEEKLALRSADLKKIRAALAGHVLPEGVADVIGKLGPVA